MEAAIVDFFNTWMTVAELLLEHIGIRPRLMANGADAATRMPFARTPSALYLRSDKKDGNRVVNVFDGNGSHAYTIERKSRFSSTWSLYEHPSRKEIATMHVGLIDRSFDFHTRRDLRHRELQGDTSVTGRSRKFYLNDGAEYAWSRDSKYLDRIRNPGGLHEEYRERMARARLMHQFRFDWELLIDETKIDREIVLTTAFITMMTEWGVGYKTRTTGPALLPKNLVTGPSLPEVNIPFNSRPQPAIEAPQQQEQQLIDHSQPPAIEDRVFLVIDDGSSPDTDASPQTRIAVNPAGTHNPDHHHNGDHKHGGQHHDGSSHSTSVHL